MKTHGIKLICNMKSESTLIVRSATHSTLYSPFLPQPDYKHRNMIYSWLNTDNNKALLKIPMIRNFSPPKNLNTIPGPP